MMLWILVGMMTVFALAMVVVPIVKPGQSRTPLVLGGIILMLPVVSILLYQKFGMTTPVTPAPSGMPAMSAGMNGHSATSMNMDLGLLATRLAEKLKNQPDNADGWALLARTYVELKKHKESLPAFEKATALLPNDARLMADYADALAMVNGGKFDKKATDLIEHALKIDPTNVKVLMLSATQEFNAKNYDKAIENWEKILKTPNLDAETTKEAQGSIKEARRLTSAH